MNEQLLKTLYERYNLSKVGTFEEFATDMQKPEVQKSVFDTYGLSKVGTFEEFQSDLGARPQPSYSPETAPVQSGTGATAIKAETPEELKAQWPEQAQLPRSNEAQLNDFNTPQRGVLETFVSPDVPGSIEAASRVSKAQSLLAKALKEKEDQAIIRSQNFQRQRWKELSAGIRTQQDYEYALEILKSELDSFAKSEGQRVELEIAPFQNNYIKEYNSDLNQLAIKNPALADGYYRTKTQESFKDTDQSTKSFWEQVISPVSEAATKFYGVLADQMPGSTASFVASRMNADYDDAIFERTVPPSVIDEYVGGSLSDKAWFLQTTPANLPAAYAQRELKREQALQALKIKAVENYKQGKVQNYMEVFGLDEAQATRKAEEDYNREKKEYQDQQVKKKKDLLTYAQEQSGEFQGRTAEFAPTWDDAKGISGVSGFIAGSIGQTLGYAVPAIAAAAASGGSGVVATIAGAGSMMLAEGGGAYEAGMDKLKELNPKLSTDQILAQSLDKGIQDAASRTAIINGLLEYAGQLTAIGKLIPKSLITKYVEKALAVKGAQFTIGATFEGATELTQGVNTIYQNNLGLGMSQQEAFDDAISKASKDEFLAGFFGGGGLSLISSLLERKKAQADVIVGQVSTNSPELDKQIDDEAEKAIIQTNANVKTQQTGVSGGEQQGQAVVQEGTQPQGSGATTEAGGLLQVSGQTPGTQAEVTSDTAGQVTPTTPQVTTPRTYQGFQRTGEQKPEEVKADTLEAKKTDIERRSKSNIDNLLNRKNEGEEIQNTLKKKLRTLKGDWSKIFAHGLLKGDKLANLLSILDTGRISNGEFGTLTGGAYSAYDTAPFVIISDYSGKINSDLSKNPFSVILNDYAEGYYDVLKEKYPKVNFIKASELTEEKINNSAKYDAEVVALESPKPQPTAAPAVTTPKSVEAVTPAAQSKYQKGQELFVIRDGQIMPVTYQSLSTSGKNASVQMSNGNRISVNPKDLFETEQSALDFMEAPPVVEQAQPETKTEEDPLVVESEAELEQLFGTGETVTPAQPEVTTEQPATETAPEATTPEATTEAAPALEPLTKVEENKIKRYFWNKNPKAFADLGTALSTTREGWKGIARRFYKTATPEEKAMLEKLVGADTFVKQAEPETTTQQPQQEGERTVIPLVDDQALTDNGYTAKQIKMVYDNPEAYAQIDNNIVDLNTNEIVKPEGTKKTKPPRPRRPKTTKKTYPKRTIEDLKKALSTNGKSIQDVLEIIAGIPDSPYADMAAQLLEILPKSKMGLKTKFRNTKHPDYKSTKGNTGTFYGGSDNQIFINLANIKSIVAEEAIQKKETDPKRIEQATNERTQAVTIHEIIHGLTAYQIAAAIPATANNQQNINALKAYLKNGKDQNIKDLIRLYLSAREQFAGLKQQTEDKTIDERTSKIYNESIDYYGGIPYGLKNIEEFLTEAFSSTTFQRLLDMFDSPLGERKSMWDSFLDAVKRILKIRDYEGTGDYMRPSSGSILEQVLTIAPNMMQSGMENAPSKAMAKESAAPVDQKVVSAVTKMAQGLINSGKATRENVIEKVKERIAGKYNIDVDAMSEDVLAGVTEKPGRRTAPVTPTSTQALLDEFNQDVNRTSMGIGQESKAFARGAKAEKLADFLKGRIATREELDAFVDAWNESLSPLPDTGKVNPDAYVKAADASRAWGLMSEAKAPKAEKVASVAEVIQAQWNARAKGIAQGVRETTQKFRENILKSLQEAIQQTPGLTKQQINQMINAVKRVNFFTAGSISKLQSKIRQLQENADLAAKFTRARQLQKSIKDLSNRKSESALANYKNIGKGFIMVDPDKLKDDNVDKYIEIAEALEAGFNKATNKNYAPADLSEVQDYINEQIQYQTEALINEMEMTESEKKSAIVDGISLEDLKKIMDELKKEEIRNSMLERAKELQQELQLTTDPRMKVLRDAKLDDLNLDELALYVKVADNVLVNDDISSVERLSSKIKAYENTKQLQEDTKGMKKYKLLPEFFNQFSQLVRQIDQIFRDKKTSYGSFYNLTGLSEYNDATARKENRVVTTAKKVEDKIEAIDKKYRGGFFGRGPSLRSQEEIIKFGILSEFSKYVADPTEHIEKVHKNMRQTIELLKKKDEVLGKKAEEIYNRYSKLKSADETIDRFKKEEPHVHELWKFFQDEVFTEDFKQELMDNTMSVHGNIFVPFINYMPTALSKTADAISTEEESNKPVSLNPQPANTTKEAKRSMNGTQYYDLGNYISRVMGAYTDSVHDIETSAPLMLVSNMTKKPEFEEIVGGFNNKERLVQTIKGVNRIEAGTGAEKDVTAQVINTVTGGLQTMGSVSALGGIDQLALQYPSAALSAMIQLGSDANLFFSAPNGLGKNSAFKKAVGDILEGKGISVRGKQHKMDLSSKVFNLEAKNKLIASLRNVTNVSAGLQKLILGPLMYSDVSVAERAFVAFYLKSLKQDGFKNVDFKKEHSLRDTPERRKALAYASAMVDDLMVSSTASGRSLFTQRKDAWAILRKLVFPFISFPVNSKIRLVSASRKMVTNPKEGFKDLASVVGEAATYNAIRIAALPLYYSLVQSIVSSVTGYEGDDEEKKNKLRKWYTSMLNDLIMPNIGVPGQAMSRTFMNGMNYYLSDTKAKTMKQFLDEKGKEDDAAVLEKMPDWYKFNKFSDMGQYGIGLDRYADILDAYSNYADDEILVLNEGSEFEKVVTKRGDEFDDVLLWNMVFQLAPYREFRSQGQKMTRAELKREIKRRRRTTYY